MGSSFAVENAHGPTASIKLVTGITVVIRYASQDVIPSRIPVEPAVCRGTGRAANWKPFVLSSGAVRNNEQQQELKHRAYGYP